MPSRNRRGRSLLSLALIVLVFGPLAEAGPDPFSILRVLGDDGSIFEWSSGGVRLRRAASPLGFTDLGGGVKDLASFAMGTRLILLTPNPGDAGKGRKRREGLAIVYDTSQPIPAVMHRILFQGDGYGVAAAPEGRRCYVLAARLEAERGGPRFWIHGLDPESGTVASTTLLERPGTGLAVAPDGARLFVAFKDRIQSYTTKPLFASWHYRSPGINGRLYFPPQSDVLYALRTGGIASFDPALILNRDPGEARDETDDATGKIPLPFGPSELAFSRDRTHAAALGDGAVAFVDLAAETAIPSPEPPPGLREADLLQPLEFLPGGDLVVGLFPAGITMAIPAPEPFPNPPAAPAQTTPAIAATTLVAPEAAPAAPPPPYGPGAPVEPPAESTLGAGDATGDDAVANGVVAAQAGASDRDASDNSAGDAGAGHDLPPAATIDPIAATGTVAVAGLGADTATPPSETGANPTTPDPAGITPVDEPASMAGGSVAGNAPDTAVPPPLEPPTTTQQPAPMVASAEPHEVEPKPASQAAPEPPPAPATGLSLSGRLGGERSLVAELVLYGPDSIIREYARVAPEADGRFRFPLPPPGTYRLVPVGESSRPVAANPNFRTITVQAGRDRADLDFSIDQGP